MEEKHGLKMSRKQLYQEIWEISARGVANKYHVSYSELLKQCKEKGIPIPPSGYWTKLRMGMIVDKEALPESSDEEVILLTDDEVRLRKQAIKQKKKRNIDIYSPKQVSKGSQKSKEDNNKENVNDVSSVLVDSNNTPYRTVSGVHNVYNRDKLYEEVWAKPVTKVAIQYGVSDVAIHKICKSLNIPVPPRGYWARIRAGEKIKKTPLPETKGMTQKTGCKTFEGVKELNLPYETLAFLDEAEREEVLLAAQEIQIAENNTPLHKKIIAYKSVIKDWNKTDRRQEGAERSKRSYYYNQPPFLAGVISDETLIRVYKILNVLFHQVEKLGGSVNDDLSLNIRDEIVQLDISENQDVVDHVVTREEAQEILKYKDAIRYNKWASQPNIRKHDYIFNGRLKISIRKHRYFRDTDKVSIDTRLGEMLIELYEVSEVVRNARIAHEEEQQNKEEEIRLKEERIECYNKEVDKTIALTNLANDFDIAARIRAYISALELKADMSDVKMVNFIKWAKKKADWYDPTIARDDEFFGLREHEANADNKKLQHKYSYYW